MPTDFQIIDGFEGLRAARAAAGLPPAAKAGAATSPGDAATIEEAFDAWMAAALGFDEPTSEQKRWLRALARIAAAPNAESANGARDEPGLAALLKKDASLEADARLAWRRLEEFRARGGVRAPGSPATFAAEAAAWSRALPRLGGIKAFRMLRRLGRGVVVPEGPARKFLWRVGLLDSERAGTPAEAAAAASALERIAQIAGLEAAELATLIDWHTRGARREESGGLCGKSPRCGACPFASGCLWFRFHGAAPEAEEGSGASARLEGIRAKLDGQGAETLDDTELLALLLHSGAGEWTALDIAEALLRKFGGLRAVDTAAVDELRAFKGVGESRARQIKAGIEIGRRLASQSLRPGDSIGSSEDVWRAFRNRYAHIPQEHFITLLLDTKNRVVQTHIVSKGTLNGSMAHPREVFKEAIRRSASAVILLHNHPSGDPTPSQEDRSLTRRLVEAGDILGIRVLDHIIMGSETYYSFKDEGRI